MRAKRANAVVALLMIAALLIHVVYEVWSYLAFYYNPLVTKLIAYGFVALVVVHILLSVAIVFGQHDTKELRSYPKKNLRTIIQRVSAVMILLLLPWHIKTGDWIVTHTGGAALFHVLLVLQVLFYAMVFLHIATSFSRALITLGWLESRRTQRVIDGIVGVVCLAGLVFAAVVVIQTQFILFSM